MLAIDYNAVGEKHKEWKVVSIEVKEYQWEDWPLEGPLSLGHLVRHFNSFGGDPKRWLGEWMRAKGVQDNDRIAHEMRCLVECFVHCRLLRSIEPVLPGILGGDRETSAGDSRCILVGVAFKPRLADSKDHHILQGPRRCDRTESQDLGRSA